MWTTFFPPYIEIWEHLRFSVGDHPDILCLLLQEPCRILADVASRAGQRALVGKVCMDRHGAQGYVETTSESLREMEAFIQYVTKCNRLDPVHTGSCDRKVIAPIFNTSGICDWKVMRNNRERISIAIAFGHRDSCHPRVGV